MASLPDPPPSDSSSHTCRDTRPPHRSRLGSAVPHTFDRAAQAKPAPTSKRPGRSHRHRQFQGQKRVIFGSLDVNTLKENSRSSAQVVAVPKKRPRSAKYKPSSSSPAATISALHSPVLPTLTSTVGDISSNSAPHPHLPLSFPSTPPGSTHSYTCILPPGRPRLGRYIQFGDLPQVQPDSIELPGSTPNCFVIIRSDEPTSVIMRATSGPYATVMETPLPPSHSLVNDNLPHEIHIPSQASATTAQSGLNSVKDDLSEESSAPQPPSGSHPSTPPNFDHVALSLPEYASHPPSHTPNAAPLDLSVFYARQHEVYPIACPILESVHGSLYNADSHTSMVMDHIYSLFGESRFADVMLELYDARYNQHFLSIPLHSAIAALSPTMCNLLLMNQQTGVTVGNMRVVKAVISDYFLTPESFVSALRFVYGIPPLTQHDFCKPWSSGGSDRRVESEAAIDSVSRALSYAAAGFVLQTPLVVITGLAAAVSMLDWDTIDFVFEFALHRELVSNGLDSHHHADSLGSLTYGNYSSQLLGSLIRFIHRNIPANFKLWTAAPDMCGLASRFPLASFSRHNSTPQRMARLGNIRFGEMTLDQSLLPSKATAVLSSILLSCPLSILRSILIAPEFEKALGLTGLHELAIKAVEERERRRQHTILSLFDSPSSRVTVPYGVLASLKIQERVVDYPQHPCGFVIDTLSNQ